MSNILNYFVGQTPSDPLPIVVMDSNGIRKNCNVYSNVEVQVIGTDNELVDVSRGELIASGPAVGEFFFRWPRPTIFNKTGVYLLQLILSTENGYRDVTSVAEIRVRDARGGNY